jgi:hypothetical protein
MLNAEDVYGSYTAPAPERPQRKRPLVVVGGSGDETEPADGMQTGMPDGQQLSSMDEESTSYRFSNTIFEALSLIE